MAKKRTLNEYRQSKDFGYKEPATSVNQGENLNEMDILGTLLKNAQDVNLEVEVVYFALKVMKKDPSLTTAEALAIGCEEWDVAF